MAKNFTDINEYCEELSPRELVVKYLNDYDRFLYKVALSVINKCRRLEVEDVKQQLILSILTSYDKFDHSKNIKHSSYFSSIAVNSANNIVKKYWQEKNRVNATCMSLDAFIDEHVQSNQFVTMFKENEDSLLYPNNLYNLNEIQTKIRNAKTYLSAFERKVFTMYLQGKEVQEIAKKLKKTTKMIYNALAVVREKIKEKM